MKSCNTLPESDQQRVYTNTLGIVKRQIHQAETAIPPVVISFEATDVDHAILLDYWTAEVALDEPEIRGTDLNIRIANNYTAVKLHLDCQGNVGISRMNMTKATSAMRSPPPAGYDGLRLSSRCFNWERRMSMGIRPGMALSRIWISR
jgi:hypothetical protein